MMICIFINHQNGNKLNYEINQMTYLSVKRAKEDNHNFLTVGCTLSTASHQKCRIFILKKV